MKRSLIILLSGIIIIPILSYTITLDNATYKVGERFYSQGLYTEAELRFLDIVRKYPDSPFYRDSLLYLGKTYAKQGKYKPALQYYKLLLNKSRTIKEKQNALLGIAKAWLQLGVHEKAAEFYAFFASEYPESEYAPAALYFAGIARERENKIDAAIEKYRAVFELYPHSDYYAKAIEKVAVLDSKTPTELFNVPQSKQSRVNTELFAHDDFDSIPGYNSTAYKAQDINVLPVAPISITQQIYPATSVLTQFVPAPPVYITQQIAAPPVVITQTVHEVLTQTLMVEEPENSNKMPEDIQQMMNSSVIHVSNGQYIPVESPEQLAKKRELEEYKKIWEAEYQAKLKEQELTQAEESMGKMLDLLKGKAQVLNVKESDLIEQKNKFRSALYNDMKDIEELKAEQKFDQPPSFTRLTPAITNTVVITNSVRISNAQAPAPLQVPENAEPSMDEINVDEAVTEYSEDYPEYENDTYEESEIATDDTTE